MATEKQRKAAELMVGNGGNVTKAMREAGYSEATVNTPGKLTKSDGFQELCEELGLTNDLIVKSLADDIKAKPGQRVQELTLAARIKGLEKSQGIGGVNFINVLLNQYGITNEGSDARETNQPLSSPPSSQA